jgi:hypothetical protein
MSKEKSCNHPEVDPPGRAAMQRASIYIMFFSSTILVVCLHAAA